MAHGSKKWIRDYSGKLKRSTNRTRDDYYGGLKGWAEMTVDKNGTTHNFCPQCKYVAKPIMAEKVAFTAAYEAIKAEYTAIYAKKYGEFLWHRGCRAYWDATPKDSRVYFDDFFKAHPNKPTHWAYSYTDHLCFKCERNALAERDQYHPYYHGEKANYQYEIRRNYQEYRAEVRIVMQKAKYDDAQYEHIPHYRRCWYT